MSNTHPSGDETPRAGSVGARFVPSQSTKSRGKGGVFFFFFLRRLRRAPEILRAPRKSSRDAELAGQRRHGVQDAAHAVRVRTRSRRRSGPCPGSRTAREERLLASFASFESAFDFCAFESARSAILPPRLWPSTAAAGGNPGGTSPCCGLRAFRIRAFRIRACGCARRRRRDGVRGEVHGARRVRKTRRTGTGPAFCASFPAEFCPRRCGRATGCRRARSATGRPRPRRGGSARVNVRCPARAHQPVQHEGQGRGGCTSDGDTHSGGSISSYASGGVAIADGGERASGRRRPCSPPRARATTRGTPRASATPGDIRLPRDALRAFRKMTHRDL